MELVEFIELKKRRPLKVESDIRVWLIGYGVWI